MAFNDPLRSPNAARTTQRAAQAGSSADETPYGEVHDAVVDHAEEPGAIEEPVSTEEPEHGAEDGAWEETEAEEPAPELVAGGEPSDPHGPAEALAQLRPVPRIAMHAWCETEGVARSIMRADEDRRMVKVSARIEPGGIRQAAATYAYEATPNLLIVETRARPSEVLDLLGPLAEVCDPSTKVVVIGHYNDIGLYRELIRSGISEYLVAPVTLADVIGVASSIFVDPDAEPLGRTIAFVGARGGVGASTICHNTAFAASRLFGSEVILADLDLPFGTLNINFDQDPPTGVAEAVADPDRLDDTYLDRLLVRASDNLSLLTAPSLLERSFDMDGEAFSQLMDVAQRGAPTVIFDVPHQWCEWTRNVLARADELVVVATPDLVSLRNTKNIVDTLQALRPADGPPKLVINQQGVPKRPEITVNDFCEPLDLKPTAVIGFDPVLFGNAANNGQMLEESDPKHEVAEQISEIAHAITGRTEPKGKKPRAGSFLSRLTRLTG